ncbi:MAG: hypothetical protein M3Z50_07960 [Actinomycetota bacterium]|nr:hypothetical protein [Actinomycetota bacterium]
MSDSYPPPPPSGPPNDPQGGSSVPPQVPPYGQPYPQQGYGAPPPPPPGGYGPGPAAPGGYGGYAYGDPGPQGYSAGTAFGNAFGMFFKNAGPFLLLTVVVLVVGVGSSLVGLAFNSGHTTSGSGAFSASMTGGSVVGILFRLIGQVLSVIFSAALVRGALDAVDGKPVTFGGMFEGWSKVQVLIAAVVVSVLTLLGLILLILPGIVAAFLLWFTNFFIVDQGKSFWDAITSSVKFTAAHVGPLLLTALLGFLCLFVGALLCGLGLLVALPVTMIAAAYAFRQLQGRPVVTPKG